MFYRFFWKITVFSLGCEDNVLETPYTAMSIPKEILYLAAIQNSKLIQQWRAGVLSDCVPHCLKLLPETLTYVSTTSAGSMKNLFPHEYLKCSFLARVLLSLQIRDMGLDPLKLGWSLKLLPLNEHHCYTLCAAQSWSCVTCALPRHSW